MQVSEFRAADLARFERDYGAQSLIAARLRARLDQAESEEVLAELRLAAARVLTEVPSATHFMVAYSEGPAGGSGFGEGQVVCGAGTADGEWVGLVEPWRLETVAWSDGERAWRSRLLAVDRSPSVSMLIAGAYEIAGLLEGMQHPSVVEEEAPPRVADPRVMDAWTWIAAQEDLRRRLGRAPSNDEIAEATGLSVL